MDYFLPYQQLAEKKGWEYGDTHSTEHFWLFSGDPMLNRKFCYLKKEDVFFWAYDMYGAKFGMSQTYSGVYRWVKLPRKEFRCTVSPRFWLDFLSKGKCTKMQNSFVDKKVAVTTNDKELASRIVTEELVRAYLELPEDILPLDIVVGADYIPGFRGKEDFQVIGIETNQWLTAEQLEQYLPLLEEFTGRIKIPVL